MEVDNLIKGIFLLILGVSGNFVAETLGCKTQKLLTESMIAKHLVIYFIIYFAIGITSDANTFPLVSAGQALIIWVLFVLFTRMSLSFTIIVFILAMMRYISTTFIEYYKREDESKNKKKIENIKNVGTYLEIIILLTILTGFILYFNKQYSEYYETWSTYKFIFGVNKCASLE